MCSGEYKLYGGSWGGGSGFFGSGSISTSASSVSYGGATFGLGGGDIQQPKHAGLCCIVQTMLVSAIQESQSVIANKDQDIKCSWNQSNE